MIRLEMKNYHEILTEKQQIPALSSGKINKYEYLTGKEILSSDQSRIIEQATFTHSPLGKVFEKQIKTIEDQREKQIKEIENKTFKFTKQIIRKRIKHLNFKRYFRGEVYNNDLSLGDALEQQIKLKGDIDIFKKSAKPQIKKRKKALSFKNAIIILNRKKKALHVFESGIFPKGKQKQRKGRPSILAKVSDRKQIKILTPKQML